MKRIILLSIVALASRAAQAAPLSWRMNYQGKILANSGAQKGQPVNGGVDLTFRIYDAASGGNVLWGPETQSGVTVTNGVFSVQLGSVLALSTAAFAPGQAYLGITVNADPEMTPRQRLVMSPYAAVSAMLANDNGAQIASGVSYATFTAAGNLYVPAGIVAATAAFTNVTAGSGTFTMTGDTQYSLQTSSGLRVAGGTLRADGSGGLAALYGVSAATGSFTAVGDALYSLAASSGILMQAGTLRVAAASRGVDATGTGIAATTVTLKGLASDPAGVNGMMAYNSASNRFRCYQEGSWTDCVRRTASVSFGGYTVLTNVGGSYDATAGAQGLGHAYVDFTNATSVDFYISVNKIGSGTQDWQLWNETDAAQIGVISDSGATGTKWLNTTINSGLPTGKKVVRVRARSSTANDDPVYYGAAILINY